MADGVAVRTASEFARLLEQSRILDDDQLQVVRSMLEETLTSRMLARRLVAKGLLTRWQAGQLLSGWTKLRLGNHKLCQQLGRGTYGRAFLAEHMRLKKEVALKTLSRRYTRRQDVVERFLQDAREVALLDHPNLVHVLDIDSDDDQYFMVMEYVVGRDLQRLVSEEGPLDVAAAAEYLRQAADGLACAHQAGIIHRDVRPANLMLDSKGVIKILGFGEGRLLDGVCESDVDDAATPETVPTACQVLEQQRSENQSDASGDIYALGCTAHYLLTGSPLPCTGADVASPADIGSDVTRVRRDVPCELAQIITRMTAPDESDRYASAGDVARALQDWLAALPAGDTGPKPSPTASTVADWPVQVDQPSPEPLRSSVEEVRLATAPFTDIGRQEGSGRERGRVLLPTRFRVLGGALLCTAVATVVAFVLWPRPPQVITSSRQGPPTETPTVAKSPLVRANSLGQRNDSSPAARTTIPAPGAMTVGLPTAPDAEGDDGSLVDVDRTSGDGKAEPAEAKPAPSKEPASAGDTVAPQSVPAPDQKPPADKTAAAAEDPWKDLPPTVDLPELESTEATGASLAEVTLAPVSLKAGDSLSVALLGGQHAAGKGVQFAVEQQDPAEDLTWHFKLLSARGGEQDAMTVARLRLRDRQLRFRWEPEAALHVLATHLRNCVVRFTLGDSTRDLRLRKPQAIEPLIVDLTRPDVSQRWPITAPPDTQHLRLAVARLPAPFPATHHMQPADVIAADEGTMLVLFGGDAADQVLILELASQAGNFLRLDCRAFFEVTPKVDRIPLTPKKYKDAVTFVTQKHSFHTLNAQRWRMMLTQIQEGDPKHKEIADHLKRTEALLAETTQAGKRIARLAELRDELAAGAAIHFRLFYQADDCEVELLRTEQDHDP